MKRIVTLAEGGGGEETRRFIEELIRSRVPRALWSALGGGGLDWLDDGAWIRLGDEHVVLSMDSHTVKPIEFPGGNLGTLAACGTINDLVVMGARPVAVMDSLRLEEGTPYELVEKIVGSFVEILKRFGVALIGGDTKVMPRGSLDTMVISTVGVGVAKRVVVDDPRPGDAIIVTGPVAEHGATILAAQLGMLDKAKGLRSDVKPLLPTLLPVIEKFGSYIHAARDPTRGGVAAVLNEWSRSSGVEIVIERERVPVRDEVSEFLEMLGIDPLQVASEGIAVLSVDPSVANEVVKELRSRGEDLAEIVGYVREPESPALRGRVVVVTEVGGRVLLEARGLNLPRIC